MNALTALNAMKARLEELNPTQPAPPAPPVPKLLDIVVMPATEEEFMRVSARTPPRVSLVYMGSTFGKTVDIGAQAQEEYSTILVICAAFNQELLFETVEAVKLKLLAFESQYHKPLALDEVNSPERGDGAWMIKIAFRAYAVLCASDLEAHLANAPLLTNPTYTTSITQTTTI